MRHSITRALRSRWLWIVCLLATLAASNCLAEEPDATAISRTRYVRLEKDKAGNLVSLQTAVVRFSPADPDKRDLSVDLIGAVHVGEKTYYEALNELFKQYDVVLYELVAPPGTRIPKGTKPGSHPVAMIQNGLKDMLGLEHQLQWIDYTRDNLVHADMSPDEFSKSMSDRGESMVAMVFRMMGAGIAQQTKLDAQGGLSEVDLLAALFDSDRPAAMKRLFAKQFESLEDLMQVLEGPQGSTIITERNKVALAKLSEQIAAGKKKIAIFYGAGHLGDMEKRLAADFHLQQSDEQWLTAWRLDKPAARAASPQPRREGAAK